VQIDLTDRCAQSCIACWLHAPSLAEARSQRLAAAAELPWALLTELLDELSTLGTERVLFSGGGEPLQHPRAWDALAAAVQRGFHCILETGSLGSDSDDVARLIDLGVHEVRVSLWAGTEQGYTAAHPGASRGAFAGITERLAELNRLKVDRPETTLCQVLTAENADELPAMLELARELGCEQVEVTLAELVSGATSSQALSARQLDAARETVEAWLGRAPWRRPRITGGRELLERLSATQRDEAPDVGLVHGLPCFAGWNFARVLADGQVIPCRAAEGVPSGSLHVQSFRSIWDGEAQALFRRSSRAVRKAGPVFAAIGRGGTSACGCELGCGNHRSNLRTASQLRSLTRLETWALRSASRVPGLLREGL